MNRRSFLRSVASIAAGVSFISPAAIPWATKKRKGPICPFVLKGKKSVPNPEWINAPYEFVVIGVLSKKRIEDPYPWRFNNAQDGYDFIELCSKQR